MEDQNIGEAQSAKEKDQWQDNQRPFSVFLAEIDTSQKLTILFLESIIIPSCDAVQEEETGKDGKAYYDGQHENRHIVADCHDKELLAPIHCNCVHHCEQTEV